MKRLGFALTWVALASLGCRKPEAGPSFEQHLTEAVGSREKNLSTGDREAYRQGFLNGARMVEAAAVAHRRPYALRLGTTSGALLPKQKLPEGMTVVEDAPPEVELDMATGLEIFRFAPAPTPGFNEGQVDGFQWAFERRRAELARPRPEPIFPAQWTLVTDAARTRVAGGQVDVDLSWTPGVLAWTRRESGFPGQRMWRPAPEWMQPLGVALVQDALWIDTVRGALALDLDSGVIRSVKPRPAPAAVEDADWQKTQAEQQAAMEKARPGLLARAAQGDTGAMLELGYDTEDPVEEIGWYRKAAELGNPKGMYEYAVHCFQGRGLAENKAEAKRWFERAAKLGHDPSAQALQGLFPGP